MGACQSCCGGRARDGLYEPVLADSEREAVADLLQYLENRGETDFFSGEPLRALSTLVFSENIDLQRSASLTFAEITERDVREVDRDTLEPILFLLQSPDIEVQRAASAALGNLAVNTENKVLIVQLDENRQQLVNAGAIPVLVQLLSSSDVDVQYYCTTALSNIAVDANNRRKLAQTESKLVSSLVTLMDSSSPKVQCQAALALRNLASDEKYQLDIVRSNGLAPLLRLLSSSYLPLILSAVACIRNISIHPLNESPIIEAGFLKPLVDLLGSTENEEIQCHAISTLRNLAASSDRNKALVLDAGAVQKCKQLVLDVPVTVQSEMTAAIAVLALSDELKSHLLNLGVFEVLIPLTHSPSIEVQGNSAAALGNLSSKVGDYAVFVQDWKEPNGGIHGYLTRFLQSGDATFQHIAIWTLLQLLESEDKNLIQLIGQAQDIVDQIKEIANRQIEPDNEFEDDDEGEVVNLAQRCLELLGQSGSKSHIEG
ncbi:vacuolar protein 8 [Colletotrichum salicis]|uniref:Vacuolar protein 8 n=1 Tax=Colletotrichum salicis TaxID=1209931 RepID=A0A135SWP9_9PEZI|nr:vacuolar protein 8 [Colletotrichum salicis]